MMYMIRIDYLLSLDALILLDKRVVLKLDSPRSPSQPCTLRPRQTMEIELRFNPTCAEEPMKKRDKEDDGWKRKQKLRRKEVNDT